ncbi:YdeI/OmpD-associated family protein [Lapillicoccus sp.]|uniref:YdeI/OmpD-associated family protein n=1 Tax=Lapillicoccus sp. TaxID=1909287 RepID=UPI0025CBC145|nr:YdeI/OmpD-associated family protein [Lapillicoccus sp.]
MRFRAELEAHGKTATGVEVPEDVMAGLGAGRRAPVRATINGYSWRTSIGAMGGRALVGVSAEVRAGAGIAAGEVVEIELEHDTEPRTVEVPDDLASALAASPTATTAFAALSHSNRRRYVEGVLAAKKPETRGARVAATVSALEG